MSLNLTINIDDISNQDNIAQLVRITDFLKHEIDRLHFAFGVESEPNTMKISDLPGKMPIEVMKVKERENKLGLPLSDFTPTCITSAPLPDKFQHKDSQGTPYDPKIHSEKMTTNKDGTWRLKKNHNKPVEDVPPPPPSVKIQEETFTTLMQKIQKAVLAGQINQAQVQQIAQQHIPDGQLISLNTLHADLLPKVAEIIDSLISESNNHE